MKNTEKAAQCAAWLESYLGKRVLPCEEVREAAYAAGFTKKDLQQARAVLHVVPGSITTWALPAEDAK